MRGCLTVVGLLGLSGSGGTARADVAADLAAVVKAAPACDPARARCVGIQLHVVVTDQGLVASADWIAAQVAEAQRHFAALDVGVQLVGIAALPGSAEHLVTRRDRDRVADGGLGGRVIHVFLAGQVDDVDEPGAVVNGVTWRRGDRKFIIVSNRAWTRTLAHELGHFFGLPHSTYAISIMNKTDRAEPPQEARTFADEEIVAMRPVLKRLLRDRVISTLAR